jgi:hypothetical protein
MNHGFASVDGNVLRLVLEPHQENVTRLASRNVHDTFEIRLRIEA